MNKPFLAAECVICVSLVMSGCNLERNSKESNDIAALQQFIELDILPRSARWEVFGTPEYSAGVPAPTDFITLIAEVPALDQKTPEKG